ncbi:hypothetical protein ABT093_09725 [Kitasatospora sp. NPDC002551]|uniref:hypothetical protein n=1 Tax=Kitasatospora sp. NPDC002551 TaxID=3154539 RepID=UPI0033232697
MSTLHETLSARVTAIRKRADELLPNALSGEARLLAIASIRRCEADERILNRHSLWNETECSGCGYDAGTYGDPVTENLNDCPELLDMAHALGLTEDDIAALERPQRKPRKPHPSWGLLGLADIRRVPATFLSSPREDT